MDTLIPYVVSVPQKPKVITLVPKDSGSRYKTKQLEVQVVGTSKMIKTLLLNVVEVAKCMQIPPEYIGMFIGYELGVQAHFYKNKPARQQAVISGEHTIDDLSRIVRQMIEEVLLCRVCGLPEVLLRVDPPRVFGDCRACGASSEMPISNEKFRRYLVGHSPTQKAGNAFEGNTSTASNGAPKVAAKAAKKNNKKSSSDEENEPKIEEVVWYSDISEEAVRKRKEEMVPKAVEERKKVADPKEIREIIEESKKDMIEKLNNYQNDCGLNEEQWMTNIVNAVFAPDLDVNLFKKKLASISKALPKILASCALQVQFLSSLEQYLGKTNAGLLSKTSVLLNVIYQEEIVDEDAVFKWFANVENSSVRKNAEAFIEWLKNAEEDE